MAKHWSIQACYRQISYYVYTMSYYGNTRGWTLTQSESSINTEFPGKNIIVN